jgi:prepilin-type N-terminal cleavage/methylation domain-containing protein
MNPRIGYTLIELLVVLLVLAILLAAAVPPVGRWRDGAAARAARDELAGRLAWTRIASASHGGARMVVEIPDGRVRVDLGDGSPRHVEDLAARYGVRVEAAGAVDSIVLQFDALGIGRMTGRTIQVRRNGAVAGLTVTPFGRYRRW